MCVSNDKLVIKYMVGFGVLFEMMIDEKVVLGDDWSGIKQIGNDREGME